MSEPTACWCSRQISYSNRRALWDPSQDRTFDVRLNVIHVSAWFYALHCIKCTRLADESFFLKCWGVYFTYVGINLYRIQRYYSEWFRKYLSIQAFLGEIPFNPVKIQINIQHVWLNLLIKMRKLIIQEWAYRNVNIFKGKGEILMSDATLEKWLPVLCGETACRATGQRSAIVSVFHRSSDIKAYCLLNGSFYRGSCSVQFHCSVMPDLKQLSPPLYSWFLYVFVFC